MKHAWPVAVASICRDVNTRVFKLGPPRVNWVLSIAGPFCFWPRHKHKYFRRSSMIEQAVCSLSAQLALPVTNWISGGDVIHIQVEFDEVTLDAISKKVYERLVKLEKP